MKPAWSSPRTSLASCSGVAISMTVTRAPGLPARKGPGRWEETEGRRPHRGQAQFAGLAGRSFASALHRRLGAGQQLPDSRKKIAPASVSATRL